MVFMAWTDAYSIGIPAFDDEHKRLVGMINQLYETIESGTEEQRLWDIVCELIDYTATHLRHEEQQFAACDYPDSESHVLRHAELRRKAFAYRNRININRSPELAFGLLHYLRDWLNSHIVNEDKKFGAYLLAHGGAERITALAS